MTTADRPEPDELLVSLSQKGDTEAFGVLVERHKEKAVRIAFAYTRNFEDARDVAQEAFVRAHGALGRFGGRSRFTTWLYRIVVNQALDFLRTRRGWAEAPEELFERQEDPAPAAGAQAEAAETRRILARAVDALSPQQKTVIVLTYFEGLSGAEAAEAMGVSEGTVRATKFQALERLKKELQALKETSHERL